MSDSGLYTSLAIVGFGVVCVLAFAMKAYLDQKRNHGKYRWQPEQDFDVVLRGETPMTPGFPTLVPRNKDKNTPHPPANSEN